MSRVAVTVMVLSLFLGVVTSAQQADEGSLRVQASTPDDLDVQWARIGRLRNGTAILVTLRDSAQTRRRFVTADPSSLVVAAGNGSWQRALTISRLDVVEVRVLKSRSVLRRVGLGLAGYFGGGIGGGMFGAGMTNSGGGMFVGMLAGAGVGAVLGARGHHRYELIYSHTPEGAQSPQRTNDQSVTAARCVTPRCYGSRRSRSVPDN